MQREEPYLVLTSTELSRWTIAFGNCETGAAWLSSARVVKCWVKSRNERNPYPLLPAIRSGTRRLPVINWRKVGMTSSHHGLYDQGYTRATMAHTKKRPRESKRTSKVRRSRIGVATRPLKSESLVIVGIEMPR